MSEKLCLNCRIEGLDKCPIKEFMKELQKRVPKKVTCDADLKKIEDISRKEKEIHELARIRGCGDHNDFTLCFPRFYFD